MPVLLLHAGQAVVVVFDGSRYTFDVTIGDNPEVDATVLENELLVKMPANQFDVTVQDK